LEEELRLEKDMVHLRNIEERESERRVRREERGCERK